MGNPEENNSLGYGGFDRRIFLKAVLGIGGATFFGGALKFLGDRRRGFIQSNSTLPPELISSVPTGDQDLTPYQLAFLPPEEQLTYVQNKYPGIVDRRGFEPKVQFPASVEQWRPYVWWAIKGYAETRGLGPDDIRVPRVDEILWLLSIETCGKAQDSTSGALWPLGIMHRWHPIAAININDRWRNVEAGVFYYGDWLAIRQLAGDDQQAMVINAAGGYNGGPGWVDKEQSWNERRDMERWINEGQHAVDELTQSWETCVQAPTDNGWDAWIAYLNANPQ